MGKFGKTKKDILALLSKKNLTLTDISTELELSPSTIKQHLDELQSVGAILPVDNEFIKRWKYYKPNPDFNIQQNTKPTFGNPLPYVIGALVLIAAVYIVISYSGALAATTSSAVQNLSQVSVRLTDPPYVPPGTSSLYINYSSIALQEVGNDTWINGTGSGTIDLLSLINSSQVIANAYLKNNVSVDKVRFFIDSAQITINGKTYNVESASGYTTATLPTPYVVGTNASILLDFSPTVAKVYQQNSSSYFALLPSIRALVLNGEPSEAHAQIGRVFVLGDSEREALSSNLPVADLFNGTLRLNISQNSSSRFKMSFTLQNNGNSTIDVRSVMVYPRGINIKNQRNLSSHFEAIQNIANDTVVALNVGQDGNITLPSSTNGFGGMHYLINPSSNYTFVINSTELGEGAMIGNYSKSFIVVVGNQGVIATTNLSTPQKH